MAPAEGTNHRPPLEREQGPGLEAQGILPPERRLTVADIRQLERRRRQGPDLVQADTAKRYWLAVRAFTRLTAILMHYQKVRTLQAAVEAPCACTRPAFLSWMTC